MLRGRHERKLFFGELFEINCYLLGHLVARLATNSIADGPRNWEQIRFLNNLCLNFFLQ